MNLAQILSSDPPSPRGVKRLRSGSPRRQPQLPPARNQTPRSPHQNIPGIRDLWPSIYFHPPSDRTATDYGPSSPLYDIPQFDLPDQQWPPPCDSVSAHAFVRPQESKEPGQEIWQSLRRSSQSDRASTRSRSPLESQSSKNILLTSDRQHINLQGKESIDINNSFDLSDDSLFNEVSPSMAPASSRNRRTRASQPNINSNNKRGASTLFKRRCESDDGQPGPSNPTTASTQPSKKQRTGITTDHHTTNTISLTDENSDPVATSLLAKQRAEQIASQPRIDLRKKSASAADPTEDEPGASKLTSMQCTICMEQMTELTATTCGHSFCRECIDGWLGTSATGAPQGRNCPTCRMPLARDNNAAVGGKGRKKPNRGGMVALEIQVKKKNSVPR